MPDLQNDAAGKGVVGRTGESASAVRTLYARTMPGGGYVRVELLVGEFGIAGGGRRRGRVVIEPRDASPQRAESAPLVVEEVAGDDENALVSELFRIAHDNTELARRVLRRRNAIQRAD